MNESDVICRKLFPKDQFLYRDHLLRLAPEDRYARFCGAVSDATVRRYCCAIDWRKTYLVGGFAGGHLRAVAELRLASAWSPRGEIALSVEAGLQGRGVGADLVDRILVIARNRGVCEARLHCLVENRRIQAIMRRRLGRIEFHGSDATAVVRLPWPNPMTWFQEIFDDSLGRASLPGRTGYDRAGAACFGGPTSI